MTNKQKPEAIRLAEWIEDDMTCNGDAEIAAELRRQHAEITELKEDAERYRWRQIDMAPNDTEVFIGAFIDGEFHFGRSVRFYECGNELEGEAWSGWVWSIDDCCESVAENPTHWMPIPDVPEVA